MRVENHPVCCPLVYLYISVLCPLQSNDPRYVVVAPDEPLQHSLVGRIVIEFPTVHVVLPAHEPRFPLLAEAPADEPSASPAEEPSASPADKLSASPADELSALPLDQPSASPGDEPAESGLAQQ
jgi:hypothetical protein